MNNDIKNGAEMIGKGLKDEVMDAKEKIVDRYDKDNDGKVDFSELKEGITKDVTEKVDQIKSMAGDGELKEKVKAEVDEAAAKIKPMAEAAKMEAEIKKEKILAEIEHSKEVEKLKDEILK